MYTKTYVMHICIHLMTPPDEDEGSSELMFFRLRSLGLRTIQIGWCQSQNGIKQCAILNYQLFFAEFERLFLLYSKRQVVSRSVSTFQWYSLAFSLFLGSHLKKNILNLSQLFLFKSSLPKFYCKVLEFDLSDVQDSFLILNSSFRV